MMSRRKNDVEKKERCRELTHLCFIWLWCWWLRKAGGRDHGRGDGSGDGGVVTAGRQRRRRRWRQRPRACVGDSEACTEVRVQARTCEQDQELLFTFMSSVLAHYSTLFKLFMNSLGTARRC